MNFDTMSLEDARKQAKEFARECWELTVAPISAINAAIKSRKARNLDATWDELKGQFKTPIPNELLTCGIYLGTMTTTADGRSVNMTFRSIHDVLKEENARRKAEGFVFNG